MRLVLDTNVLLSGIFFSGPRSEILAAWREGRIEIVVSREILDEYRAAGEELETRFAGIELRPWLELIRAKAATIPAPSLQEQACSDPDDDKFLACALAGRIRIIVSGDKALLRVSGYEGVEVITPRAFVDRFLRRAP